MFSIKNVKENTLIHNIYYECNVMFCMAQISLSQTSIIDK